MPLLSIKITFIHRNCCEVCACQMWCCLNAAFTSNIDQWPFILEFSLLNCLERKMDCSLCILYECKRDLSRTKYTKTQESRYTSIIFNFLELKTICSIWFRLLTFKIRNLRSLQCARCIPIIYLFTHSIAFIWYNSLVLYHWQAINKEMSYLDFITLRRSS